MGTQWLTQIADALAEAGFRTEQAYPGGFRMEISETVAAVGLRDLDYRAGMAEFEVRILSPGRLGGWNCQSGAAKALTALEELGLNCKMEPMAFRRECGCFEICVRGKWAVLEPRTETRPAFPKLRINNEYVSGVAEFTAEQDGGRELIGSAGTAQPVGITAPRGGWKIRMVQVIPPGQAPDPQPEEPFVLDIRESGRLTAYTDCGWNRVVTSRTPVRTQVAWEGFALRREEFVLGEYDV